MFAAYEQLSPELKARIRGLKARHSFLYSRQQRQLPSMKPEEAALVPPVEHPLVRRHPDGRHSLFVSATYMEQVVGLREEESRQLLGELMDWAIQERFHYRHRWRVDDVLMWDNRANMHYAVRDYDENQPRFLHRTTAAGERPV